MKLRHILATVSIVALFLAVTCIAAGQQSTISASPSAANPGDKITVIYSGAPGFDTDWIAIYRTNASNERYGEWYYLRGNKSGTLIFTVPKEAGEYEFRMFRSWGGGGGYNDIARSNIVSVGLSSTLVGQIGSPCTIFDCRSGAPCYDRAAPLPLPIVAYASLGPRTVDRNMAGPGLEPGDYLVWIGRQTPGYGGVSDSWKAYGPFTLKDATTYLLDVGTGQLGPVEPMTLSPMLDQIAPGRARLWYRHPTMDTYVVCIEKFNVLLGPENLMDYRNRVGETLSFRVTGSTGGTVWGTDIYTDDSSLATAAVHAGLLRPGEDGVVTVSILPGRQSYAGSSRNGVTTSSWDEWPGSYTFVRK